MFGTTTSQIYLVLVSTLSSLFREDEFLDIPVLLGGLENLICLLKHAETDILTVLSIFCNCK